MIPQTRHHLAGREKGRETKDISVKAAAGVAAAVALLLAAAVGARARVADILMHRRPVAKSVPAWSGPPVPADALLGGGGAPLAHAATGPRLQETPRDELARWQAAQRQILESYGRTTDGGVRIPVEAAMDIVVRRGLLGEKSGEPQ